MTTIFCDCQACEHRRQAIQRKRVVWQRRQANALAQIQAPMATPASKPYDKAFERVGLTMRIGLRYIGD
jgi:hypothetical protein